ncbi:cation diffusion facilitator family transporter [Phycicoccus flavus]|uniref:cation diffusion facilitator family transporter n=1 Tax=Phycicoccus flavus TaxID=2502783 RepID=UPI000FEBFD9E|nr:cation diffusion facilitator family transporter [Phycicoccus flavus]NHA67976.1 cation diffusion facilitator family transporter [Phycicoccus flavus]
MANEESKSAIMAAFLANLGVAVTKFVAFLLTGFSSMLAESIHSVADTGNQLLLLLGSRRASREATLEHPFGYGQQRYVYSFLVAIMLFVIGGLFALYEAYEKIHSALGETGYDPFESRWWWVPLAVVVAAMVMEGFSLRTAVRQSNKIRGRRSWLRFIRSTKSPELPVVLLEDFGALIGLSAAFLGIGLTILTANQVWDGVGSGVIGVLLIVLASFLAVEMGSLLVGEAASPELRREILRALESPEGVDRVINSRTMHLGPDEILVAAKLAVGRTDDAEEITSAINQAESAARECAPELHMVIYLEPDLDTSPDLPSVDGPGVTADPRESAVEDASRG